VRVVFLKAVQECFRKEALLFDFLGALYSENLNALGCPPTQTPPPPSKKMAPLGWGW
jgi:hypothetical protein